jgi:hypothetical protein
LSHIRIPIVLCLERLSCIGFSRRVIPNPVK